MVLIRWSDLQRIAFQLVGSEEGSAVCNLQGHIVSAGAGYPERLFLLGQGTHSFDATTEDEHWPIRPAVLVSAVDCCERPMVRVVPALLLTSNRFLEIKRDNIESYYLRVLRSSQ
ncbi:hypothetical protein NDU88_004227 [Pleurodeles waltl]|uniref:Uncharacterized protein n=1 Tax=Pleurodeles waltl TaxID=8319 RepID=A0AAV7LU19_PLEWA|nr:hypothetical protein NDU88_004227 [Pleurodeles waltl]